MHSEAVTAAGMALIRFAQSCGLIRGEWIAIDGSKFRAVASVDSTRERLDLQRYLESIEKADKEQQANINPFAVQAAVDKLKRHPEPEAGYMLVRQTALPAYNIQTAVDAEHALIVAHAVVLDASDIRCLKPMAEAAKRVLKLETFNVVADAGYSNGEPLATGGSVEVHARLYHGLGVVASWPGCTWVATTLWLHRSIWSPQSSGHATRSLRDRNAFQSLGKHWVAKQTAFIAGSDTRFPVHLPPSVSAALE
jgi:hypothetical protein